MVVFALAALDGVALAAALPGVSPEDANRIMPVSQLKRGMRGYGLTVFHGTKIEKFDVEILGVLKQVNTGKDLIIVRIGGGPINTRQTGIIAGMSGSPVYINGKLVGAIAYGGQFTKEPVGMLTPIADMLEAWDENLPKNPSGFSSNQSLPEPISVNGKSINSVQFDEPGTPDSDLADGVLHLQPLMTPLTVSGLSSRGIERLAEILRPYRIRPVAGMGGGPKDAAGASLAPGAAVGMSLARGDIDMTAIGTLTYRRGNRIVAFGHPTLGIGSVDAPMTTAYVDDIMSSYRVSTKMASPLATVGRIFQDRPWSIAGIVGGKAKTIPATIQIDDQAFGRKRTFRVNVINHPLLASRILTMMVGEAIFEAHPAPGDATAEVSYDVVADQIGKISRSNVFFDPTSIDGAAIFDIGTLLQLLSSNRFYPLDIMSISVKIKIAGKRNTATVDRIFVKKSEYEPGENVEVGVVLRPYRQERITKTFNVKIPASAPDGKITLMVRGGATPTMMMMMAPVGAGPDETADAAAPPVGAVGTDMTNVDNVKQLVSKYLEREKNNDVVVQLLMRSTAISVFGEKLTGLPSALADVMKSTRNSGLKMERDEVKQMFPQESLISGNAQLLLSVKRKDLKETKSPQKIESTTVISSDESDMGASAMSSDYDMTDYATTGIPAIEPLEAKPSVTVKEETESDGTEETTDEVSTETTDTTEADKTAKPGDTTSTTPPKAEAKTEVKPVARQLKTWAQRTQTDFSKGTFSGMSASSENKLELVPIVKKLSETPEQFVWCVAAAENGVYAGTGNSGKIFRVGDDGKMTPFYETGELEVHSLATDASGNLYAATSPHGKVFKISPEGKGEVLATLDEKLVLALAMDPDGNLYAGVGNAGKVYRIAPGSQPVVFAEVNEQHILSLCWEAKGSLLVGTGINGSVYRVSKLGNVTPIFDAAEDSASSVLGDADGNLYVGTSPKGSIYRVTPDGRSKAVYTKAARVLSMARDKRNNVYAVCDSAIVRITPGGVTTQLDSAQAKTEFLALAYSEKSDSLYAGSGNTGSVYTAKCADLLGKYESPVHDALMISKWSKIKWNAVAPEGASVEVRTRTGNVAAPDNTWTAWSQPRVGGEQLPGDPARFIQYQVALRSSKDNASPTVSSVTMTYQTPNQAPTVALTSPAPGDVLAGKETIKWTGVDPDKDTLTYDVFYSKDGKDWKALVGGVSGGKDEPVRPKDAKTTEQIVGKVKSELEKSKDVPEDMKTAVLKGQPDPSKPGKTAPTPPAAPASTSGNTSYTWDTSTVEDGIYVIKVVASDKTSNGSDALTKDVISEPLVVCNAAPKVSVTPKKLELKGAGSAAITGSATAKAVEITGVQFKVDTGSWMAATAVDGMFDSSSEEFTLTTESLAVGDHKVEVQAVDAAGNAASSTVEVKVVAAK